MSEQVKDQQEMIACKKNADVDYFIILLPKCVCVGVSEHPSLEKGIGNQNNQFLSVNQKHRYSFCVMTYYR